MAYTYRLECCGIAELDGISAERPETIIKQLFRDMYCYGEFNGTYAVFSNAIRFKSGNALARFIRVNKLGSVQAAGRPKRNPNSGNQLKVWMWSINRRALERWAQKNGFKKGESSDSWCESDW